MISCLAGDRAWLPQLFDALSLLLLLAPVVAGWTILYVARRHHARLGWPVFGVVAAALAGASAQLGLVMPQAGEGGAIAVSATMPSVAIVSAIVGAALLPAGFTRLRGMLPDA